MLHASTCNIHFIYMILSKAVFLLDMLLSLKEYAKS